MRNLWNIFGSGDSIRFRLFRHGWPTANPLSGYYLLLPVSSPPSHAWLLPSPTAYVLPVTLWSCSCPGIMSGWEARPEVEMTQGFSVFLAVFPKSQGWDQNPDYQLLQLSHYQVHKVKKKKLQNHPNWYEVSPRHNFINGFIWFFCSFII